MTYERRRPSLEGQYTEKYELRLSRDDVQMLFELREKLGKSKAAVLRLGLRRLYDIHIGLENLRSREVIYRGQESTEKETEEETLSQCAHPSDT